MIDKDAGLTHYRGLLARVEDDQRLDRANRLRAAQGQPPLTQRQVDRDLSYADIIAREA
jgi:hypothetical protein